MTRRILAFAVAAGVVAVDQATKLLAHAHLQGRGPVEVVPGLFNLWYSTNRGGLFGYFRDLGEPWHSLLLNLLPAIAIVLIAGLLWRDREPDGVTRIALALILGGAIGNLFDRLVRGAVIDFLDVYAAPSAFADRLIDWFGTSHWPTFNVADSAIVVGACLMLYRALVPHVAPEATLPSQEDACSRS